MGSCPDTDIDPKIQVYTWGGDENNFKNYCTVLSAIFVFGELVHNDLSVRYWQNTMILLLNVQSLLYFSINDFVLK